MIALIAADGLEDGEVRRGDFFFGEALADQLGLGNLDRALAVRAELAREALGDDQTQCRGDVVRRHTHVHETHNSLRGVVGMQRRQHQVTGLRGFDRDLGGFQVADFADHDDVRILAQKGFQRRGERQADAGIDVDLVDAGQVDFRRVLGRRDVDVVGVEDVQPGVQRHGLARASRASYQNHALRLLQRLEVFLFLVGFVAERVDAELRAGRIEDTAADLFAEQRRAGADAEVDRLGLGDVELDAAVLRHAALGEVEPRHHLDARGDAPGHRDRRRGDRLEFAVLAVADAEAFLVRLEVDVRGALVDRIDHQLVDVADDRRVFGIGAGDVVGVLGLVTIGDREVLEVGVAEVHLLRFGGLDREFERADEFVLLDQHALGHVAGGELDLVERLQIGRVGNRDKGFLAAPEQRQRVDLAQHAVADFADDDRVDVDRAELEQRGAEFDARRLGDLLRREVAAFDQRGHERGAGLQRLELRLARLLLADQLVGDQTSRQSAEEHGIG